MWHLKHHSCFKFYYNIKIKQYFNCFFYEHIEIQCFSHTIKYKRYANSDHNWKNCLIFKLKIKCIFCKNIHSSVNQNCTIRHKKMKKQKKTTVFLFFYYSTFLFSFDSNSVFCSSENRSLTIPKPQFSIGWPAVRCGVAISDTAPITVGAVSKDQKVNTAPTVHRCIN